MMLPVLLVALAQQPLPPDAQLPPNHPPMNRQPGPVAPDAKLPPNHPAVPADAAAPAPDTGELMKKLDQMENLKDKEKTFEVAASLGRLYYAHGRYGEAATYLEQAMEKAKPAREAYVALRKTLGGKPVPTAGEAGCSPKPDDQLQQRLEAAKKLPSPAAQAACIRTALHPLIEVETELGNVRFILHDTKGALAAFDDALDLFDSNPEARYGRAAILLDTKCDDLSSLKAAKADFERFVKDYPTSPRAKQAKALLDRTDADLAAGGKCVPGGRPAVADAPAEPMHPPMLTQDTINALQNVKKSDTDLDETTAKAEDLLAHGKYQDALDTYKQVMPFRPDPRVRAGMAWTLNRLGKPMADNIWRVALADPAAIDALGDTLKAKGDADGAKALWTKLKETAPEYASRVDPKLR